MSTSQHLTAFNQLVCDRYHLYDKLFLQLPFENIPFAGHLLPEFSAICLKKINAGISPLTIVNDFLAEQLTLESFDDQVELLQTFLQFIERQIVLFDALESSAYPDTHDLSGEGSLTHFLTTTTKDQYIDRQYQSRLVLTAHPTQFYSKNLLYLIEDIADATAKNDLNQLKRLLLQLGKTPFFSHKQPTPVDEANLLIDYLTKIFYPVMTKIHATVKQYALPIDHPISLGFWPGSDRDGNPSVNTQATLNVAATLKREILSCYLKDIQQLQRRLTFRKITAMLERIHLTVRHTQMLTHDTTPHTPYYQHPEQLKDDLQALQQLLITEHQSLFIEPLNTLIESVQCFGFHFASLDLRQDSDAHSTAISELLSADYAMMSPAQRLAFLKQQLAHPQTLNQENASSLTIDTIASLQSSYTIQQQNGERGLHRYIISNTKHAFHVYEVLVLAHLAGLDVHDLKLDIVPLFESVTDLNQASATMTELWEDSLYRHHINRRAQQTIMLGFSDGTKDGGYIAANWLIYTTKKQLAAKAEQEKITILFFDGRGGPPARGGGNSHLFYRAQPTATKKEIQLTIQGQTISSNFGTIPAATYNLEQLFTAGLVESQDQLTDDSIDLLSKLSELSLQHYQALKSDPLFIEYLEEVTPLPYFGELNIASRPPKRGNSEKLTLTDLRAIPFVGSWSQMKQNVPGFYGVGTALQALIDKGQTQALISLYQHSLYFSTLMDNAMQSLAKSFFPLTAHLAADKKYGKFWQNLASEAELSVRNLLLITQQDTLLANDPVLKSSINLREQIVLPLQVIQQYILMNLRTEMHEHKKQRLTKLLLKTIGTNINASRNSA